MEDKLTGTGRGVIRSETGARLMERSQELTAETW